MTDCSENSGRLVGSGGDVELGGPVLACAGGVPLRLRLISLLFYLTLLTVVVSIDLILVFFMPFLHARAYFDLTTLSLPPLIFQALSV